MLNQTIHFIDYLTKYPEKAIFIWLFNIGAERYWHPSNEGVRDINEDAVVNRVEEMNLLICRKQDMLLLREMPDEAYLTTLEELGFSIPTIVTPKNPDAITPIAELVLKDAALLRRIKQIKEEHQEVYLVPYAVTQVEEKLADICKLDIIGASAEVSARVNHKIFSRKIAQELGFQTCKGHICRTVEEIRKAYFDLTRQAPFFKKVIVKEPSGASGKGLYLIDREEKLEITLRIIARYIKKNHGISWLVEGWYDRKTDFNYQIYISPKGEVDTFSVKQQILKDTLYIGSKMPPDVGQEVIDLYREYGMTIGKYLYSIGYTGIAGIDSIIGEDQIIIPIIEINGRFTLSTYISFIQYILGERKFFSRYFRVLTNRPVKYKDFCEILSHEGVLFTPERRQGIMVYTAGSLPLRYIASKGVFLGRLFVLIIADDDDELEKYLAKIDNIVQRIAMKTE